MNQNYTLSAGQGRTCFNVQTFKNPHVRLLHNTEISHYTKWNFCINEGIYNPLYGKLFEMPKSFFVHLKISLKFSTPLVEKLARA